MDSVLFLQNRIAVSDEINVKSKVLTFLNRVETLFAHAYINQ